MFNSYAIIRHHIKDRIAGKTGRKTVYKEVRDKVVFLPALYYRYNGFNSRFTYKEPVTGYYAGPGRAIG